MNRMRRSTFVLAVLYAVGALAHGAEVHLKGSVVKVEGTAITIAVENGDAATVKTDQKTEFQRGDVAVTLAEVTVGERVAIHAGRHDGALLATLVKLPPGAKAH